MILSNVFQLNRVRFENHFRDNPWSRLFLEFRWVRTIATIEIVETTVLAKKFLYFVVFKAEFHHFLGTLFGIRGQVIVGLNGQVVTAEWIWAARVVAILDWRSNLFSIAVAVRFFELASILQENRILDAVQERMEEMVGRPVVCRLTLVAHWIILIRLSIITRIRLILLVF